MENEEKKIVAKLQTLKENDLTKNVIIPLLESMGFNGVEFNGGVAEEGKDIVFWETDKFGDLKLIVAQVKHFKFTNKASDPRSLQTVYNQLTLCFAKKIPSINKVYHVPSEALLISTFPIDTKSLLSKFGSIPQLKDQQIKIIDGITLAGLLLKYKPDIVKQLTGIEIEISSILKSTLNNEILLKALGFHDKVELQNIYTDIDFSIGKASTELFFNATFNPVKKKLNLLSNEWDQFKSTCLQVKNEFALDFLNHAFDKIEGDYKQRVDEHIKWQVEHTEFVSRHAEQRKKINDLIKERNKIEKEDETKENEKSKKSAKKLVEKGLKNFGNQLSQQKKLAEAQKAKTRKYQSSKLRGIKGIIEVEELKEKKLKDGISKLLAKEPKPDYTFILNGLAIAKPIRLKRKWIEENVARFNLERPEATEIKAFIEKCKSIIDAVALIFGNAYFKECLLSERSKIIRTDFESTRFNLPVDQVFDTGLNIVLLGEAGAGKTTSLQMYALRKQYDKDKLIIWAPLARVVQLCPNYVPEELKERNLDEGIAKYLSYKGIAISTNEFRSMLQAKRIVLLLDGVDESIRSNPWLPRGIRYLAKKYEKQVQVIVTSRMSGSYLNEIPFFAVTLLPFTSDQRDKFIVKWFDKGNETTIRNVKSHLKNNKAISEIVKNPLLTTVLCVLAKHNIPLPNTEIRLYDDRMKLLTGYYDNVKEITTRISLAPQTLETVAQKLSYYLHSHEKREESLSVLEKQVLRLRGNNLSEEDAVLALNELIDPCNILVPMTEDGKYGFGHLRYQEHLSAKEMNSNRSIDIFPLLEQNWWRDALILFSQMSDNLEWLISVDLIFKFVGNKISKATFTEMIEKRPTSEQIILEASLKKVEKVAMEIYNSNNKGDNGTNEYIKSLFEK